MGFGPVFRQTGVKGGDIGQHNGIGAAMGEAIPTADGVRHRMVDAQHGMGEGDARHAGGVVHMSAGGKIFPIPEGDGQPGVDEAHRLFCQSIGEIIRAGGYIGLNGVGQHIHACVCRDGGRHAAHHGGLQDRQIGQQAVIH